MSGADRHEDATRRSIFSLLYVQVLIAIAAGIAVGLFWPSTGAALQPLGDGFIKLVKMIIAPVIFLTIVTGIGGLSQVSEVGRVGGKAFAYFITVSTLALIVGLVVANLVQPGAGMNIDPASLDGKSVAIYAEKAHEASIIKFLLDVIPTTIFSALTEGSILQVLLVAILFGIAIASVGDAAAPVLRAAEALSEVVFRLVSKNTVNASLGAASPTSFYVGRTEFNQQVVELTGAKDFDSVLGMESLNVAMGLQWRRDNFQVHRGDPASYAIGPLTLSGKAAGANGRPGYAPQDENDLSRRNIGAFVDVEADVTDRLLLTAALRYENYSDFGGNVSGKFAGRFKLSDSLGLRASYNRGFRAPSLAQIGNRVNTSTVQNGLILQTQQISSDDVRLARLGVPDPKAEISDSFAGGITGDFGQLTITLDAFQINIKDRIAITDGILVANFPAVAAQFPGVREIRFFTNQIDTRTRGVDLVATYRLPLGGDNKLSMTLAGSHAQTKVLRQRSTPATLIAGASAANQALPLVGLTAIELIEVAQPRTKVLFSANADFGDVTLGTRASYFGSVKAFSTGLSASDQNVTCNSANRCVQTFAGKALFDLNLTYRFSDTFSVTAGGNNIFDTYPDKWNARRFGAVGEAASYSNGQTPYTRNAGQFGFNGAYYYLTANVNF